MQIDYKHNQLLVSFNYNSSIIRLIKQIDGRRWEPKRKVWTVPALLDNLSFIKENYPDEIYLTAQALTWEQNAIEMQERIANAQKFKNLSDLPTDYSFKTKPFSHQVQCFNFFKNLDIGGLFLEMGLGKTKIIVDLVSFHYANGNIKKILYVCPNSVIENVKDEFMLHSQIEFRIAELTGPKIKRIAKLENSCDVYIINYEALKSLEPKLLSAEFDCIICDESTRIKNPQAQCSKVLHRLGREVKYRYILTGTPITQSAIDIFSQYKFLEPSIFGSSYYAFRNKYAVMGGFLNKQIIGYRQLEELEQKLFSTAIRFTKQECLDLPSKIYEVKQFDLNKKEQELYNQIKENIFIELQNQQVTAPLIITKLMKLNQICSGFIKTDISENVYLESSKLKLLQELVEDIAVNNKIIIWCNFLANIKMIENLLIGLRIGHVCFSGDVPQIERQYLINKFQKDPKCKVFVGQIQTGGMGINLTAASYVIYYSNTYSLANRLQSEDRAHRIGQKNKVTYIDLVARKTVEKSILKALKKKLDLSKEVIDLAEVKSIAEGEY